MIVVVEGPSAAGKTTWCAGHESDTVIAETGRIEPPAKLSDNDSARFWNEINCLRWRRAIDVEDEHGLAICDTDPLKLHYDFCLAQIGAASWTRFEAGVEAAAEAIASRRLGIADIMLVSLPSDEDLLRQRDSDPTRRRSNFELHRRLGPGLRNWYSALARLDPGRVIWEYPSGMPPQVTRDRYDADLFRDWMSQLPRDPTGASTDRR